MLEIALERPGTEHRVVTLARHEGHCLGGELQADALELETLSQLDRHQRDDAFDLLELQRLEEDGRVDVRIGDSTMPLADFDRYREEVVDQVRNAGQRRTDNMVAMAKSDLPRLAMHVRVLASARRSEQLSKWVGLLGTLGTASAATLIVLIAASANQWGRFGLWSAAILCFALFSTLALWLTRLIVARRIAAGERGLDARFEAIYATELATEQRDDLRETWQGLRESLPLILRTLRKGMSGFPGRDLHRLDKVIEKDLPRLGIKLPKS